MVWGIMSWETECAKCESNEEGIDTREAAVLGDFGDDDGIGVEEDDEDDEDEEDEEGRAGGW